MTQLLYTVNHLKKVISKWMCESKRILSAIEFRSRYISFAFDSI